jgi:hypothetical protein
VVQLIVQYGLSWPSDWILYAGGWLCLLGLVVFLLRREARHLLPGPQRRKVLQLMGTGAFLMAASYPLLVLGIPWEIAVNTWSASVPAQCSAASRQALLDQGPLIGFVGVALLLVLFGAGFVLIELANRSKRELPATHASG